jgi:hypothetical protein
VPLLAPFQPAGIQRGDLERLALGRFGDHVEARDRRRKHPISRLVLRRLARTLPFGGVDAPVMVGVEAGQQPALVLLPLMQQRGRGRTSGVSASRRSRHRFARARATKASSSPAPW